MTKLTRQQLERLKEHRADLAYIEIFIFVEHKNIKDQLARYDRILTSPKEDESSADRFLRQTQAESLELEPLIMVLARASLAQGSIRKRYIDQLVQKIVLSLDVEEYFTEILLAWAGVSRQEYKKMNPEEQTLARMGELSLRKEAEKPKPVEKPKQEEQPKPRRRCSRIKREDFPEWAWEGLLPQELAEAEITRKEFVAIKAEVGKVIRKSMDQWKHAQRLTAAETELNRLFGQITQEKRNGKDMEVIDVGFVEEDMRVSNAPEGPSDDNDIEVEQNPAFRL